MSSRMLPLLFINLTDKAKKGNIIVTVQATGAVFDRLASMDKVWMESCHLVHVQDTLAPSGVHYELAADILEHNSNPSSSI
uniref:Uncharacterized protein n=1 Tax=Oncorhynchus mykiss TaxID=8022 RepID=A0A8K9V712_ONCMY